MAALASATLMVGGLAFEVIDAPLNPNTSSIEIQAVVPHGMSCHQVQQVAGQIVGPLEWSREGCGSFTAHRLTLERCQFMAQNAIGEFRVLMTLRPLKEKAQSAMSLYDPVQNNTSSFIVGIGEFPVRNFSYTQTESGVHGQVRIRRDKKLSSPDCTYLIGKRISILFQEQADNRLIRHAIIDSVEMFPQEKEKLDITFSGGHFETPAADWKSLSAYGALNQESTVQWKMPPASWVAIPDEYIHTQPFMPSPKQFGPSPLAGALKNYPDAAALSAAAASIMGLSPKPVGAKAETPKPKPPEVAIPPKPRRKFFDDP